MTEERREFQRLHLTRPVNGSFGELPVRIVDVSAIGALIELDTPLSVGAEELLRFVWRDSVVTIPAVVARADQFQTGLKFTEDSSLLRDLIAKSAKEVLTAQMANVDGDRAQNVVGDETLTAASARLMGNVGYMTYTYSNGEWKRRRALIAEQPPDGFTISAAEPEEQVEMLRQTYVKGDEQARHLLRVLAELSCVTVRGD